MADPIAAPDLDQRQNVTLGGDLKGHDSLITPLFAVASRRPA